MLESPTSADAFEIFGITERENAYTSLLAYLLKASAFLTEHVLKLGFSEPPPALELAVHRQCPLNPSDIVDILLEGKDAKGQRWALFIETKVHSAEFGDQTERYHAACQARVGASGQVGGLLLTLEGEPALCKHVRPLRHRDLAVQIDARSADFAINGLLQQAAAAYVTRARVPVPVANDHTPLTELLARHDGLVPRLAGANALAKVLTTGIPGGWIASTVWIQGRGHANPGLLLRQAGWEGPPIMGKRVTRENFNLHLELELTESVSWRLKLHFETQPYLPQRALAQLDGNAKFIKLRETFRALLVDKLGKSSGWKAKGRKLQIAVFPIPLAPEATVTQLRDALTPALQHIAPRVASALATARGE